MRAKIAKFGGGERQPGQDGAFGVGHQPTRADTGSRKRASATPAGEDKGDTTVLDGGEAARPTAVVFSGGPGKQDRKSAFPLCCPCGTRKCSRKQRGTRTTAGLTRCGPLFCRCSQAHCGPKQCKSSCPIGSLGVVRWPRQCFQLPSPTGSSASQNRG